MARFVNPLTPDHIHFVIDQEPYIQKGEERNTYYYNKIEFELFLDGKQTWNCIIQKQDLFAPARSFCFETSGASRDLVFYYCFAKLKNIYFTSIEDCRKIDKIAANFLYQVLSQEVSNLPKPDGFEPVDLKIFGYHQPD